MQRAPALVCDITKPFKIFFVTTIQVQCYVSIKNVAKPIIYIPYSNKGRFIAPEVT